MNLRERLRERPTTDARESGAYGCTRDAGALPAGRDADAAPRDDPYADQRTCAGCYRLTPVAQMARVDGRRGRFCRACRVLIAVDRIRAERCRRRGRCRDLAALALAAAVSLALLALGVQILAVALGAPR